MHTTSIYLTTATLLLVAASGLSLAIAEQPPQEAVSTSNNQAAAPVVNNNVNANGAPSVESAPAVVVEHHHASTHHSQVPPAPHYAPVAPAGVVQVVGEQQQQSAVKPQPVVGSYSVVQAAPNNAQPLSAPTLVGQASPPGAAPAVVEQYGQPESAAMPPNYRAFGGWGLYIGGQPADGYYSSYYKALSSSVDKQQQQQQQFNGVDNVKPALSPLLRQANVSPSSSLSNGFYPNDYYTPADLNSGLRVPAGGEASSSLSTPLLSYSAGNVQQAPNNKYVSPVQAGAQVYGTPFATYEPVPSVYATTTDGGSTAYGSTKKSTPLFGGQKDAAAQGVVAAKGYQQQQLHRYGYVYSPALSSYVQQAAAPQVAQQVVAYPVPVGSQIVGSQPGVEGSYQPYGVYGFTRYAIKPTVVATEHQQTYYHQSAPIVAASQFPVYKQQQHVHQHHHQHQPSSSLPQALSFYGYPLSQLHYASSSHVSEPIVAGQVVGVVSGGSSQHLSPVDASSVDKSSVVESSDLSSSSSSIDKQQVVKQTQ